MGYKENHHVPQCLECGDSLEYGRPDRKFCCDTCKNRFNNRKARDTRAKKTRVLNILERNHSILSRLIRLNMTSLSVSELRQLGFDFDYITSFHKNRRHDEYGCFDINVVVMSSRVISITRVPFIDIRKDECQKKH
ncbi:MAG: hypothetical protein NC115_06390 [Bacteroidales bacterium]|nr:hypothetical protein [Bacteroides sp.]MCM1197478.1 hypothetical protein [Clostridium sp.]MCM1502280.1 hypothetical protein [Bacteroidales bacterium]